LSIYFWQENYINYILYLYLFLLYQQYFFISRHKMQKEILMYSSHPDITPWDLKNLSNFQDHISIQDLKKTQEIFQKNNIKAFTLWSEDYHYRFHSILSSPYIVHYIWDISLLDREVLWIVWPRKPSTYSNRILKKLFEYAKDYNLVTISGMADWVDQMCHALSIKHKIPTIAVLWWGIHHYLKWPHRHIIKSIVEHWWLVISEYKIDFKPTHYSFPQRNRLIAWLCDVLFLPEAGQKSGSLITADFAHKSSKKIFTVPNDIFVSTSFGTHELLSCWKANLLLDFPKFFQNHFSQNQVPKQNQKQKLNLPAEQDQILQLLDQNWTSSLSFLMQKTNLDTDTIMQHITLLEINSLIYQETPGSYKIT